MDFTYLKRSTLFEGLTKSQIEEILPCFGARTKSFKKGTVIYGRGTKHTELGLILKGDVRIDHADAWGRITLLSIMEQGKTFGEATAVTGDPVAADYVADHDCTVLFLNVRKMMRPCQKGCTVHRRVASNLTQLLARRNLELARRAYVLGPRSIRAKVMGYLSLASHAYGSLSFEIPYNREQLANYLGVDRSALSAELSRMAAEGMIAYKKNHFELRASDVIE